MRKIFLFSLIPLLAGCLTDNKPSLTGSYYRCLRDGEYQETKISWNRIMFIGPNFPDNINIMSNQIHGNEMILAGLNFDLMFGADTLKVLNVTDSSLTLNNRFGDFELKRLNIEIPNIDLLNLERTVNKLKTGFYERSLIANCPDLRTEEEKNPPDLGEVEEEEIELDIEIPTSEIPVIGTFNIQLDKVDSINEYGAGDCWGNIKYYSYLKNSLAIDSMTCSEYGFTYTNYYLENEGIRAVYIQESSTKLGLNGAQTTYELLEKIYDYHKKPYVLYSRSDVFDTPDFELFNDEFELEQLNDYQTTYEHLMMGYQGTWEMEEDY